MSFIISEKKLKNIRKEIYIWSSFQIQDLKYIIFTIIRLVECTFTGQ